MQYLRPDRLIMELSHRIYAMDVSLNITNEMPHLNHDGLREFRYGKTSLCTVETAMSQPSQPVPPSNNQSSGFMAKMGADADAAWPLVVVTIAILVGVTEGDARDFLDSHYGAAFADDLRIEIENTRRSMRASVINVTILWMAWRVPGGVRHYLKNLIRRVALCSACTLCPTSSMLCVLTNDPCGLNRKPQEIL